MIFAAICLEISPSQKIERSKKNHFQFKAYCLENLKTDKEKIRNFIYSTFPTAYCSLFQISKFFLKEEILPIMFGKSFRVEV